tara:strand:+ start:124 stop:360 length:237 start_codon:yes stop_codon:yes gene_type:complete
MVKVKIYTTPTCPWCKKAKEFMKEKKISFKEIDVASDEKGRKEMIDKSGQMGVPVLEINGEILVGYDPDAIEKAVKKK